MTKDAPGLVLPSYYSYYDSPVKIVASGDGPRVWRVSMEDGSWQEENEIFEELVSAIGGEIFKRTAMEFVQDVERYRAEYLSGDGPIYALYETAKSIIETGHRERRSPTTRELALVRGIRQKTFAMFEEELQRAGDPGADPSLAQGLSGD
ncbi:hypothetical protein V6U81_23130 [Micromonospora sp. CPCC 205711]|uniref:hypothetical protein n=1 Tax=Micromonospora sp. CPCC 205547 TaxID=3122400 RepID=UPI002FF0286B